MSVHKHCDIYSIINIITCLEGSIYLKMKVMLFSKMWSTALHEYCSRRWSSVGIPQYS